MDALAERLLLHLAEESDDRNVRTRYRANATEQERDSGQKDQTDDGRRPAPEFSGQRQADGDQNRQRSNHDQEHLTPPLSRIARAANGKRTPSARTMDAGLRIASPRLESAAIAVGRLNLHFA